MSFFHGVTVTNVDTGARTISLPSSSIIGLCDTFEVLPAAAAHGSFSHTRITEK